MKSALYIPRNAHALNKVTGTHPKTDESETLQDEPLSIRWGLPRAITQKHRHAHTSVVKCDIKRMHSTAVPHCGSSYPVKA